jgi:hypothetical protein
MLETSRRVLIAALPAAAVLLAGGTRPPSSLALAAAAAVTLVLALLASRKSGGLSIQPFAWPLAIACAATLAQLVPLPHAVRALLSPATERAVELALRDLPHGSWRPLTADVAATLESAARLFGVTAFLLALAAREEDERRLVRGALLGALGALAGVTLWNLGAGNAGRALVRFPFANPNHAGALLALALPVVLAMAARADGGALIALGAALLAGNALLAATVSRSAIAFGLGGQSITLVLALRNRSAATARLTSGLFVLAALAALVVGALPLIERLRSATAIARSDIWRGALPLLRDHWPAGIGRGALAFVYPRYGALASHTRFAFVENEWLELPVDLGVPVAFAVLATGAWALGRVFASELSLGRKAALAGIGALAAHSFFDFAVEAPGVALSACLVTALACPTGRRKLTLGAGLAFAALTIALAAAAFSPLGRSAETDADALRAAPSEETAEAAFRRHPADGFLADLAAESLLRAHDPRAAAWLERALVDGPNDPLAHRLLARALAMAGLRDQAAAELHRALAMATAEERIEIELDAVAIFGGDGERMVKALPDDALVQRDVLGQLLDRKQLAAAERVATALLALDPRNSDGLRGLLAARVGLQRDVELDSLAERLLEVDRSPSAVDVAMRALARVEPARADQILDGALARATGGELVPLATARARRAIERNQLDSARTLLESALARAVSAEDKAGLHDALADVDDKAGRPNRAALERAEAARFRQR